MSLAGTGSETYLNTPRCAAHPGEMDCLLPCREVRTAIEYVRVYPNSGFIGSRAGRFVGSKRKIWRCFSNGPRTLVGRSALACRASTPETCAASGSRRGRTKFSRFDVRGTCACSAEPGAAVRDIWRWCGAPPRCRARCDSAQSSCRKAACCSPLRWPVFLSLCVKMVAKHRANPMAKPNVHRLPDGMRD